MPAFLSLSLCGLLGFLNMMIVLVSSVKKLWLSWMIASTCTRLLNGLSVPKPSIGSAYKVVLRSCNRRTGSVVAGPNQFCNILSNGAQSSTITGIPNTWRLFSSSTDLSEEHKTELEEKILSLGPQAVSLSLTSTRYFPQTFSYRVR